MFWWWSNRSKQSACTCSTIRRCYASTGLITLRASASPALAAPASWPRWRPQPPPPARQVKLGLHALLWAQAFANDIHNCDEHSRQQRSGSLPSHTRRQPAPARRHGNLQAARLRVLCKMWTRGLHTLAATKLANCFLFDTYVNARNKPSNIGASPTTYAIPDRLPPGSSLTCNPPLPPLQVTVQKRQSTL